MTGRKITIIIVTYNSRLKIADCLASVFNQNYPASFVQTVAVDNDSSDSTVNFIREKYPKVKIIQNQKNTGFAQANNQGYFLAQKNKSEYLFLLNDDAILERNCLTRLVNLAEKNKNIGAVQAKLLLYPQKELINSFGNSVHFLGFAYCNQYKEKDQQNIIEPFEIPYASGAASLIRMSILKKTGLFDRRLFLYHEDVDLGWRLRLNGYKIILDPLAVAYHKYHYSKAKYKFYYMERNRWVVILQNYHLGTLLLLLPALMVMELGIFFFALKNGWLMEKLKGGLWIFIHWPSILSRRINIQFKIRRIKDRQILKLFTGSIKFQEVVSVILNYLVNPLMEVYLWVVKRIIFW